MSALGVLLIGLGIGLAVGHCAGRRSGFIEGAAETIRAAEDGAVLGIGAGELPTDVARFPVLDRRGRL